MFGISLKIWRPISVDILIYDRVGSEFLRRAIGKYRKVSVLEARKKVFNFHPVVLRHLLSIVVARLIIRDRYWKKLSLRVAVELAVIRAIKPKVVISHSDNSVRFNLLSRLYSDAKFIGVQNAFRSDEIKDVSRHLCLTNLICFGEDTKRRYEEANCGIGNYVIGGSLKDGLYRAGQLRNSPKIYDICWISQYKPARFDNNPILREMSLKLLEYLQQFCVDNGKSLAIACACKEWSFPYEYKYLLSRINISDVYYVPHDDNNFSSYRAIDRTELTVTTNSTLGYESLGRGNKVLFCNLSKDSYYDMPGGKGYGPWALSEHDASYERVGERLEYLYNMAGDHWFGLTKDMAQDFVQTIDKPLPQDIVLNEVNNGIDVL
jgi:surface carbohydrate biosynthesis protein